MGFGRNPHIAKAEAEEQKARCAKDAGARQQALREAARQWDRAAEREGDEKRRQQYADKAAEARARADNPDEPLATSEEDSGAAAITATSSKMLN